jgi:hypothetical protein
MPLSASFKEKERLNNPAPPARAPGRRDPSSGYSRRTGCAQAVNQLKACKLRKA